MQFEFPSEEIPSFSDLTSIKKFINQLLVLENLSVYCSYKFRVIRQKYIYCMCRDCTARIVFHKEGGLFVLRMAKLHHQHQKIGAKRLHIIEAIKDYPSCFNIQTIKKMTMNRFKISSSTFYRYLRMSKTLGQDIQTVLTSLEQQGIFGVKIESAQIQSKFPGLLILTSQLMIKTFFENGRNVKFDITYNIIRERSMGNRQYSVGAFVTQNNRLNIQPVALAIMEDQTKENFIRLFTQFIYLMKQSPLIMITDEQKSIQLALSQLKQRQIFNGVHLIDVFHVLRNFKKALYHKPTINNLISLSRSSNLIQYAHKKQKCLQNLSQRDQNLFRMFQQKIERCCLAQLPPVFIGLACTTNSIQKLNDIMKSNICYSQNYTVVVAQLSKLLLKIVRNKKPIQFEKVKVEQFVILQQIQELRFRLCKPVFRKLMRQLSLSGTCIINCTSDPDTFVIQQNQFEDDESFDVKFDNESGNWICDCLLTKKIGIPCAHIIKVMILKKQNLIHGINPWWLLKDQNINMKNIVMRPRKTRRNFK